MVGRIVSRTGSWLPLPWRLATHWFDGDSRAAWGQTLGAGRSRATVGVVEPALCVVLCGPIADQFRSGRPRRDPGGVRTGRSDRRSTTTPTRSPAPSRTGDPLSPGRDARGEHERPSFGDRSVTDIVDAQGQSRCTVVGREPAGERSAPPPNVRREPARRPRSLRTTGEQRRPIDPATSRPPRAPDRWRSSCRRRLPATVDFERSELVVDHVGGGEHDPVGEHGTDARAHLRTTARRTRSSPRRDRRRCGVCSSEPPHATTPSIAGTRRPGNAHRPIVRRPVGCRCRRRVTARGSRAPTPRRSRRPRRPPPLGSGRPRRSGCSTARCSTVATTPATAIFTATSAQPSVPTRSGVRIRITGQWIR